MPFIAFLGCDGSGKSAVIQGVAARIAATGVPVVVGHWRPDPFASSSASPSSADDPHGQSPRNLFSSILKLGWLWINWWIAWILYLYRDSRSGYVLFDRYHGDLLVDPKRYRYGGPQYLARLASRWMPQPDRVIYLDASPDVLLSRKQEVAFEALELSRVAYRALGSSLRDFEEIDASESLERVVCRVMMVIQ